MDARCYGQSFNAILVLCMLIGLSICRGDARLRGHCDNIDGWLLPDGIDDVLPEQAQLVESAAERLDLTSWAMTWLSLWSNSQSFGWLGADRTNDI